MLQTQPADPALRRRLVAALLARYPTTFAADAGVLVADEPGALFRLLCAALLYDAHVLPEIAATAARHLWAQGWVTPARLEAVPREIRAGALGEAAYARFNTRMAVRLGEQACMVRGAYGGDLRRLREKADRDPLRERTLLGELPGMGPAGVSIFCREVQPVWDELYPFADARALGPARRLGLGTSAAELAELTPRTDFVRLVDALVKTGLNGDYEAVLAGASRAQEVAAFAPALAYRRAHKPVAGITSDEP